MTLEHELDLRRRGFSLLTSHDVPSPALLDALPSCRVQPRAGHGEGRSVWSHPGPSGLDPRALGALSLVRVADGLGPDRLDTPVTLGQALRWLLIGPIEPWLTRPRHRAVVNGCLQDSETGCTTHRVADADAQRAADALGDPSAGRCPARRAAPSRQWAGAPVKGGDVTRLAVDALAATQRLGCWYVDGLRGAAAWELARHGVSRSELAQWPGGLGLHEVVRWCSAERPTATMRQRDRSVVADLVAVVPRSPTPEPRGMNGWGRFGHAKHGRQHLLTKCYVCGAEDDRDPCRTCRQERRTTAPDDEWTSFAGFATIDTAYAQCDPGDQVLCGRPDCR